MSLMTLNNNKIKQKLDFEKFLMLHNIESNNKSNVNINQTNLNTIVISSVRPIYNLLKQLKCMDISPNFS